MSARDDLLAERLGAALRASADEYAPALDARAFEQRLIPGSTARTRAILLTAAAVVVLALAVAAIRFSDGPAAVPPAATATSDPAAPTLTHHRTAPAGPVLRSASPAIVVHPCRASALAVSIPADSIAGSMPGTVGAVRFRNTGRSACSLAGYPSVSVTGTGVPLRATFSRAQVTGAWGPFPAVTMIVAAGGAVESSLLVGTPVDHQCATVPPYTWHIGAPGSRSRVDLRGSALLAVCPTGTQIVFSPVHRPAG